MAIANGDRTEISFAFSSAFVMGTLLAPFIGRLLDRSSPKNVLTFGIAIVTVSYLLLSQVETILQFYLVTTIGMGLGMACMGGLAWHRSIINWFDHWRGRAIALGVLGASLSGIVMPQFVPELIENYGWQMTYGIFAISTAATLFPVVYFFMKDKPEEIGEVRDGQAYVSKLSDKEASYEDLDDQVSWTIKQMLASPAFWSIGLLSGSFITSIFLEYDISFLINSVCYIIILFPLIFLSSMTLKKNDAEKQSFSGIFFKWPTVLLILVLLSITAVFLEGGHRLMGCFIYERLSSSRRF